MRTIVEMIKVILVVLGLGFMVRCSRPILIVMKRGVFLRMNGNREL